jgi:hypothetical protein
MKTFVFVLSITKPQRRAAAKTLTKETRRGRLRRILPNYRSCCGSNNSINTDSPVDTGSSLAPHSTDWVSSFHQPRALRPGIVAMLQTRTACRRRQRFHRNTRTNRRLASAGFSMTTIAATAIAAPKISFDTFAMITFSTMLSTRGKLDYLLLIPITLS